MLSINFKLLQWIKKIYSYNYFVKKIYYFKYSDSFFKKYVYVILKIIISFFKFQNQYYAWRQNGVPMNPVFLPAFNVGARGASPQVIDIFN